MTRNQDKIDFCARYLSSNGIDAGQYESLVASLSEKPIVPFALVRQDDDFFTQVAQGLWNLWPKGTKDGKWAWKESVPVLADRLEFIWRQMHIEEDYSVEDCLEAGRRYLARFEHESTKYMLLLKYFIFKQKEVGVKSNSIKALTYESMLVKTLQDKTKEDKMQLLLEGEIV